MTRAAQTEDVTGDGPDTVTALVDEVLAALVRPRLLLGIAGQPGTGKSTLASELVDALVAAGTTAVLVPMDGFHLAQRELERLGRADRKGAPDTFDVDGYVAILARLRVPDARTVYAPEFRREIEEPVAGAVAVGPDVRVVVTEGNYLLHDDHGGRRPRPARHRLVPGPPADDTGREARRAARAPRTQSRRRPRVGDGARRAQRADRGAGQVSRRQDRPTLTPDHRCSRVSREIVVA